MADPVFALSPISARGSLPTEADYDAIREAFMETARGRWFLTEYAKRNRNSDTNLVLDAVSRLEATLSAQKQDQRDRTQEVIAAIHALVIEARSEAAVLISVRDVPDEDSPALKGVRVLREMAWTLRESGSDGRIPDLLKRQADAIEEGLKAAVDDTARDHLLSIFDRLAGEVEDFGNGSDVVAPSPLPAQPEQAPASEPESMDDTATAPAAAATVTETAAMDEPQAIAETPAETVAVSGERDEPAAPQTVSMQTHEDQLAALQASMEESELVWDETEGTAETASAADDVGQTTAATAVDTMDDVPAAAPVAAQAPQSVPVEAIATERMAALEAAIMAPVAERAPTEASAISIAPSPPPAASLSLGAALLEKGIVARPDSPRSDPLAPFRRMTQAERIAFFS